jgi:hypothetical protein
MNDVFKFCSLLAWNTDNLGGSLMKAGVAGAGGGGSGGNPVSAVKNRHIFFELENPNEQVNSDRVT